MLRISIVCPDMLVTTSPGFVARPDGMFSQAATRPITLTFAFSSAIARSVAEHAGGAAHVEFHLVHVVRRA